MKENSRYNKKGLGYYFIKRFRILILFALILHCVMFICIVTYKDDSIISNDRRDIFRLEEELSHIPFEEQSISDVFTRLYPNFFDYDRKGLEKAAIVISAENKDILAANDFTLPENKLPIQFKVFLLNALVFFDFHYFMFHKIDIKRVAIDRSIASCAGFQKNGYSKARRPYWCFLALR